MDATTTAVGGELGKAIVPLPAGRNAAAASTPSPRRSPPLSNDAACAVVLDGDAPAVAGSEREEDDNEQVERFYALLANIRALRSSYSVGGGVVTDGTEGVARKQARRADPPWRPAFRLEDFEGGHDGTARAETVNIILGSPSSPETKQQAADGEDRAAEAQPHRAAAASPAPALGAAVVPLRRSKKRRFERLI